MLALVYSLHYALVSSIPTFVYGAFLITVVHKTT